MSDATLAIFLCVFFSASFAPYHHFKAASKRKLHFPPSNIYSYYDFLFGIVSVFYFRIILLFVFQIALQTPSLIVHKHNKSNLTSGQK